jgi:hypothetical protein
MQYNADFYIEKLLNYYNISTISELAQMLNTKQTSISSWRTRNSVNAIKKKCREFGIYNEIFGDVQTNNFQNSNNITGQDFSNKNKSSHIQNIGQNINIDPNILKLVDTLYSFALSKQKVDELKTDLSALLTKYM